MQKKRLDYKEKVNFIIYDVTTWLTNNSNTRSRNNQTMKFVQVIEYNKKKIFFKNDTENQGGITALDLFLFFKKALYEVKAKGLPLSFNNIFRWPSTCHSIKTNYAKLQTIGPDPANIYLFKVNNRNTRRRCEICSKLTRKSPERRQLISLLLLVFLLLTLNT